MPQLLISDCQSTQMQGVCAKFNAVTPAAPSNPKCRLLVPWENIYCFSWNQEVDTLSDGTGLRYRMQKGQAKVDTAAEPDLTQAACSLRKQLATYACDPSYPKAAWFSHTANIKILIFRKDIGILKC